MPVNMLSTDGVGELLGGKKAKLMVKVGRARARMKERACMSVVKEGTSARRTGAVSG